MEIKMMLKLRKKYKALLIKKLPVFHAPVVKKMHIAWLLLLMELFTLGVQVTKENWVILQNGVMPMPQTNLSQNWLKVFKFQLQKF
jgi:hypothetical protein